MTGSGTLRTGAAGSSITLLSDSGIRTLVAAGTDAATYAIYAPGNHSTVTLQSASLSSGPEIRIDSAILAAGNITTQSSSADSIMTSTVVSASGRLESLTGNITVGSAELIAISGTLLAGSGTITVTSTANTTLASTSRIDSSTAISLTAGADLLIDGTVGTQIAPLALSLIAATGKISVAAATGRLHSARSVLIDAQTVHFDGVLQTAAETADADDYEVRVLADTLRLTGSFGVQAVS